MWLSVSASQLRSWQTCKRLWHFLSIMRVEVPREEAQDRGVAVHKVIESFLKKEPEPLGMTEAKKYAESAKEQLRPYLAMDNLIEQGFEMPTFPGGPIWKGFIDLLVKSVTPKIVGDHKTTSDFRYRKTPAELVVDPQLVSYARKAADWFPGDEGFTVTHFYVKTRAPFTSMRVDGYLSREKIMESWNGPILDDVKKMQVDATAKSALDLPPTLTSCRRYGRPCAFVKQCQTDVGRFAGIRVVKVPDTRIENLDMSMMKEKEKMEPTNPGNGVMTPTTTNVPNMPGPKLSLADKLKLKQSGAAPAPAPAPPPAEAAPPKAPEPKPAPVPETPAAPVAQAAESSSPIIPPDAPPRDAARSPGPTIETKGVDEEKPKRGRPRGSTNKEGSVAEKPAREGFAIYVDCIPLKGEDRAQGVLVEDFLAPLLKQIAESHGVENFRLIEYAKWEGPLETLVKMKANATEIPSVLLVSSFSKGAHVVVDVLTPFAAVVVKGMR